MLLSAILLSFVKSLRHIHKRGVCHNDIKPENIIVGVTRARYSGDGNPDDMEGVRHFSLFCPILLIL